jgi:hypothetical protein
MRTNRHQIKSHPIYFTEFDHKKNPVSSLHLSDASSIKVHWICKNGHEWYSSPLNRNSGLECPFCPKKKKVTDPVGISVVEYFSIKNDALMTDLSASSLKTYRWVCDENHEWLEPMCLFDKHRGCSRCDNSIYDAETFIRQQYPDVPVEVIPLEKDATTEYSNTFKFYEDEIYHKWAIVKSILDNYSDKTIKINSVKLKTKYPDMDESYLFEKENSLVSTPRYGYAIGLYKDDELYQCIRYLLQKDGTVKIFAITTKNGYNVAGGYSRLLRELDKKIHSKGFTPIKYQLSVNMRFNNTTFWDSIGFHVKSVRNPTLLSDGFVRTSSKNELKDAFKIKEFGYLLLEKYL